MWEYGGRSKGTLTPFGHGTHHPTPRPGKEERFNRPTSRKSEVPQGEFMGLKERQQVEGPVGDPTRTENRLKQGGGSYRQSSGSQGVTVNQKGTKRDVTTFERGRGTVEKGRPGGSYGTSTVVVYVADRDTPG